MSATSEELELISHPYLACTPGTPTDKRATRVAKGSLILGTAPRDRRSVTFDLGKGFQPGLLDSCDRRSMLPATLMRRSGREEQED
jgi:hypothetical protein